MDFSSVISQHDEMKKIFHKKKSFSSHTHTLTSNHSVLFFYFHLQTIFTNQTVDRRNFHFVFKYIFFCIFLTQENIVCVEIYLMSLKKQQQNEEENKKNIKKSLEQKSFFWQEQILPSLEC